MEIEITPAEIGDAQALTDLINEAYAIEAFFVEGPRVERAAVERQIVTGSFYKAEGPGRELLGCVLYQEPARESDDRDEAYFGLLAVAPSAQGRGLGRRLVRFVERRATTRGKVRMGLRVVDLRAELGPWYAKQGYRVVGSEPFSNPERQKRPCRFLLLVKDL